MKLNTMIISVAMAISLASCTNMPNRFNSGSQMQSFDENDFAVVASNLINVMAQLEHTQPLMTTFQMVTPSTPFGFAVMSEVESLGYGIQLVSGDLGDTFLRYKAEVSQSEAGFMNKYSLNIGDTTIEREFVVDEQSLMPTTPVTVKGTHSQDLEVDDGIFGNTLDASITQVVVIEEETPEVIVYASSNAEPAAATTPIEFQNVFDMKKSNYSAVFEGYEDLERRILVFSNDSLVLGKANKDKINDLVDRINPDTDVISIIGCSHGNSAIDNGNQILAEGRTQRVKESFMFSGISADNILDEACWSAEYWDEAAPRRGVMVTHKRKIS